MADLKQSLNTFLSANFLTANRNVTKKSLQIRLLKKIFTTLNITKKDVKYIVDPQHVFIHPQVSEYLNVYIPANDAITQKIFSGDYHSTSDVDEFCKVLDGVVDPALRRSINVAFAFDGFRGQDLKNYKDNLSIEMNETPYTQNWEDVDKTLGEHVRAVRHLYGNFGSIKRDIIHIGIQCAFDGTQSTNSVANKIAEQYKKFMGPQNFERTKKYIESNFTCFNK